MIICFTGLLCATMMPIVYMIIDSSAENFHRAQMTASVHSVSGHIENLLTRKLNLARATAGAPRVDRVMLDRLVGLSQGEVSGAFIWNEGRIINATDDRLAGDWAAKAELDDYLKKLAPGGGVSTGFAAPGGEPSLLCAFKNADGEATCLVIPLAVIDEQAVSGVKVGESGYVFVLAADDTVLIHPKKDEVLGSILKYDFGALFSANNGEYLHYTWNNAGKRGYSTINERYGFKTAMTVNLAEIEGYGRDTVLFMSIFLGLGLLCIGGAVYKILDVRLRPLGECRAIIVQIGEGRLAHDAVSYSMDDIGVILGTVIDFAERLAGIITRINDVSSQLASSAEEVSGTATSFAGNAQIQAASVEEVTATVEEITAGMQSIARGAEAQAGSLEVLLAKISDLATHIGRVGESVADTDSISRDITVRARDGAEALTTMNGSIQRIAQSSGEMTNIVKIINDISEQINLL